jgi:putative ABC transport system ATP-binding protein
MSIIQVENISKTFEENSLLVNALKSVSLKIDSGAFVALSGPSGSGKTTLLNLMGCLDRPSSGKIILDGEDISMFTQQKLSFLRLKKIGFIFQDYNLIPTLTAEENIEYVLWLQEINIEERKKRVKEIAQRFGIADLIYRKPSKLSRGQQQRVAVARALVHKPLIVLGDELTANLDHETGIALMDFLKELNVKEQMTFVYATHDAAIVDKASAVIKMQDGCVINGNI